MVKYEEHAKNPDFRLNTPRLNLKRYNSPFNMHTGPDERKRRAGRSLENRVKKVSTNMSTLRASRVDHDRTETLDWVKSVISRGKSLLKTVNEGEIEFRKELETQERKQKIKQDYLDDLINNEMTPANSNYNIYGDPEIDRYGTDTSYKNLHETFNNSFIQSEKSDGSSPSHDNSSLDGDISEASDEKRVDSDEYDEDSAGNYSEDSTNAGERLLTQKPQLDVILIESDDEEQASPRSDELIPEVSVKPKEGESDGSQSPFDNASEEEAEEYTSEENGDFLSPSELEENSCKASSNSGSSSSLEENGSPSCCEDPELSEGDISMQSNSNEIKSYASCSPTTSERSEKLIPEYPYSCRPPNPVRHESIDGSHNKPSDFTNENLPEANSSEHGHQLPGNLFDYQFIANSAIHPQESSSSNDMLFLRSVNHDENDGTLANESVDESKDITSSIVKESEDCDSVTSQSPCEYERRVNDCNSSKLIECNLSDDDDDQNYDVDVNIVDESDEIENKENINDNEGIIIAHAITSEIHQSNQEGNEYDSNEKIAEVKNVCNEVSADIFPKADDLNRDPLNSESLAKSLIERIFKPDQAVVEDVTSMLEGDTTFFSFTDEDDPNAPEQNVTGAFESSPAKYQLLYADSYYSGSEIEQSEDPHNDNNEYVPMFSSNPFDRATDSAQEVLKKVLAEITDGQNESVKNSTGDCVREQIDESEADDIIEVYQKDEKMEPKDSTHSGSLSNLMSKDDKKFSFKDPQDSKYDGSFHEEIQSSRSENKEGSTNVEEKGQIISNSNENLDKVPSADELRSCEKENPTETHQYLVKTSLQISEPVDSQPQNEQGDSVQMVNDYDKHKIMDPRNYVSLPSSDNSDQCAPGKEKNHSGNSGWSKPKQSEISELLTTSAVEGFNINETEPSITELFKSNEKQIKNVKKSTDNQYFDIAKEKVSETWSEDEKTIPESNCSFHNSTTSSNDRLPDVSNDENILNPHMLANSGPVIESDIREYVSTMLESELEPEVDEPEDILEQENIVNVEVVEINDMEKDATFTIIEGEPIISYSDCEDDSEFFYSIESHHQIASVLEEENLDSHSHSIISSLNSQEMAQSIEKLPVSGEMSYQKTEHVSLTSTALDDSKNGHDTSPNSIQRSSEGSNFDQNFDNRDILQSMHLEYQEQISNSSQQLKRPVEDSEEENRNTKRRLTNDSSSSDGLVLGPFDDAHLTITSDSEAMLNLSGPAVESCQENDDHHISKEPSEDNSRSSEQGAPDHVKKSTTRHTLLSPVRVLHSITSGFKKMGSFAKDLVKPVDIHEQGEIERENDQERDDHFNNQSPVNMPPENVSENPQIDNFGRVQHSSSNGLLSVPEKPAKNSVETKECSLLTESAEFEGNVSSHGTPDVEETESNMLLEDHEDTEGSSLILKYEEQKERDYSIGNAEHFCETEKPFVNRVSENSLSTIMCDHERELVQDLDSDNTLGLPVEANTEESCLTKVPNMERVESIVAGSIEGKDKTPIPEMLNSFRVMKSASKAKKDSSRLSRHAKRRRRTKLSKAGRMKRIYKW